MIPPVEISVRFPLEGKDSVRNEEAFDEFPGCPSHPPFGYLLAESKKELESKVVSWAFKLHAEEEVKKKVGKKDRGKSLEISAAAAAAAAAKAPTGKDIPSPGEPDTRAR
ncbi:hypothetical protein KPH14_008261 [Odynerus spinipes]|uniref:Uncharacterized protein n=1 Tax=Odynerus spinipes TaxID=1348599 RepID=A0AAD9RHD9_9HYME|nr:hypothetical protein KPH14_008261 [Odynerus spinipes]